MRFLNPAVLPWLWLAVVPVALYLFRRKSRTVRVSTLLFFKSLAREHQESAWLRRLKRWLSLLLSLLLVCGPVVGLGRLIVAPAGSEARSVVVVVDTSASMAARDGEGRTRLERAQARVRSQLAGVSEGVPVALVAAGATPEIVHPRSTNRRDLLRALGLLKVKPVADNAAAALATATAMAALETPAEIWWASENGPDGEAGLPVGVRRRDLVVALEKPINAGITAFSVTPMPLLHARYQAFVQVALNSEAEAPRVAVVEPRVAGLPLARRELTLQPGAMQGLTLEIEASQEQVLEVSLQMEGDMLEADNMVVCRLPAPRPLVVAWFTPKPDPFTLLALQSLATEGEVEVFTGEPAQWPPPRLPDVAIFDGWLPAEWPAEVPVLVINPPGSAGPVRARPLDPPVPRDEVRAVADEHPVLFRLNPGRVALTQTAIIDASGALQPLWMAGDQPVLAAGESGGQRLVILACAPALSERLPLTTSYPLFLGNALFWCAEKSALARIPRIQPTGTLVEDIRAPMEWRELKDGKLAAPAAIPAPSSGIAVLDRLGLWQTTDRAREGAAALLSQQETNLNAPARVIAEATPPSGERPSGEPAESAAANPEADTLAVRRFGLSGELTHWVIAMVLAALLIESWLYHRHAVS
ncbi:MAG: VWA domain-containing protein [Verrucomicrobiales bacterium]